VDIGQPEWNKVRAANLKFHDGPPQAR
jgi:hypothetical protein